MDTINHDFDVDLASIDMKLCATGFTGGGRFVSLRIRNGVIGGGEFGLLITPDEARAVADAFTRAANFAEPRAAEPRAVEAADYLADEGFADAVDTASEDIEVARADARERDYEERAGR